MERAFQLLNSAGSWSDRPFDSLSLNIIHQIAAISPKATYIRQFPVCMQKIDWASHNIPYSLQHVGYYLVAKQLIQASEQLNFMHSSPYSKEMLQFIDEDEYDDRLLAKLYWDYRHLYNPSAQLSAEIEAAILDAEGNEQHEPHSDCHIVHAEDHRVGHLVNDMYHSGDVRLKNTSELGCFPLNKWLTDEYTPNMVWLGLLQLADSIKLARTKTYYDDIARFTLLLDFLHYISNKRAIRPYSLQILHTVLNVPTISLTPIPFPPFTQYTNIQQVSVTPSAICFDSQHTASERRVITEEIKDCFKTGNTYKDQCHLATAEEKQHIKLLLKSWQLNQKLQQFLNMVQDLICPSVLVPWKMSIAVFPQQFMQKSIQVSYQIKITATKNQIDEQLLVKARQKYLQSNSKHLYRFNSPLATVHQQREFPIELFSSLSGEIGHHFRNQLSTSWKQWQSTQVCQKVYPSKEEIVQLLHSYYQESFQLWTALSTSITFSREQLFDIGLLPRITPFILISLFQRIWLNDEHDNGNVSFSLLTDDECLLLGGIIANWVTEQQLERALHVASQSKWEEYKKELANTPHVNWTPSEHLPWLIFELETNITIREIQVDVTRHMIQPNLSTENTLVKNMVMQMNMGEGKTSVIIPMLALALSSSQSSLVRVVVLKSLFHMNYQLLRYKLGGLLNRRIFPFACRRDMDFNSIQMSQIFDRFHHALHHRDIVLVSPEDILSFDLLTIDKCRRYEFETGRSMLNIQRWLKTVVRDILDESDEILHCKYQLIYTVGIQQQIDGSVERWNLIQTILHSIKNIATDFANSDQINIYYRSSEQKSGFPQFRLLTYRPFRNLCIQIAQDWLSRKRYRKIDTQCILSFILDIDKSVDALIGHFPPTDIQIFLVLRGLLSGEVLYVALQKRYRVNYGINPNSCFKRLMAVPFRAKDVPAERTEFGHPDIALVLTQLSYYYSGLNDMQLFQCLDRLNREERDPESIYAEWIAEEYEHDVQQSVKQWKGINLEECEQETHASFSILRYNMLVINYFLNHFVFPREAKQFPYKLISSAWDLSSPARAKLMTGFSGTNDTQLLLPVHVHQQDLPQLLKTDAIVLNNLLQPENDNYQHLPMITTSKTILYEIAHYQPTINVILDVGALFVDGKNRDIAVEWLKLSDKAYIDYAIYFESDSIIVCDRQWHHHTFLTSPASERLDRCVIYLDQVHTRGTDFRFPSGFKAAVTLGNGLTKDHFVQACMRMRQLGEGHSLIFWSSDEVHRQITTLKVHSFDQHNSVQIKDILRWVYENTKHAIWDGLYHWAIQSLSFQRKVNAFQHIHWTNHQQIYTKSIMQDLAMQSLEPEIIELQSLYGVAKALKTISEIYKIRYECWYNSGSEMIHKAVLERLDAYGGSKQRLAQFLDEEQQRELEQELEQEQEREQEQEKTCSQVIRPCEPVLHDEIKKLCTSDEPMLNLAELPHAFRPLTYAFINSTFAELCQPECWSSHLWISAEFQRVIENKDESLDSFLRPPRWMIIYRNEHIILVNAFEANWLMGQLQYLYQTEKSSKPPPTTLRLMLPRLKPNQSILVNTPTLVIPPSIKSFVLPTDWLIELYIFNGTIYFDTIDEQTSFCRCLALCPKPWTLLEENAFENGWISTDGFVPEPDHRVQLEIPQARFKSNPLPFVKQLLKHRNNACTSLRSHVGSIIFNGFKLVTNLKEANITN